MYTRHRSRDTITEFAGSSGDSVNGFTSGTLPVSKLETMDDVEITNFHQLLKSGSDLPVNPMHQQKTVVLSEPNRLEFLQNGYARASYSYLGYIGDLSPVRYSGGVIKPESHIYRLAAPAWPDESQLLTSALAEARQAGLDVATMLAEYNKTLGLIADFALNIRRRASKILKKRNIKTYREFLDAWMEYRYGWRILYYDLVAIQESISILDGSKDMPRRFTSYDENTNSVYSAYSTPAPYIIVPNGDYAIKKRMDGKVTGHLTRRDEVVRSVRAGVGMKYLVDLPGSFDPLMTAWEIVPFSFIADWFINIGDTIGAFSPFGRGQVSWAFVTKTEYRLSTTQGYLTSSQPTGGNSVTITSGDIFAKAGHIVTTRVPVEPEFDLSFRFNVDFPKIIDLTSIVSGFIDGPSRRKYR